MTHTTGARLALALVTACAAAAIPGRARAEQPTSNPGPETGRSAPAPDQAPTDHHGMVAMATILRALAGEETRVRGTYAALGLGWEPLDRISVQGELGFAWGVFDSGLFPESSVHHVSVAPRVRATVDGETDTDVAALFGHSWQSLVSLGIEGGVDLRFGEALRAGPLVKGRIGFGPLVMYAMLGALLGGDEPSAVFGIGLEVFRVPRALPAAGAP